MKISLKDQVVLLTGGSRGIGKAIALQLGRAGATVALHYNQSETAAQSISTEIGNGSSIFQSDLHNLEQLPELVKEVIDRYGKIHVLINNAAISLSEPTEGKDEEWLEVWMRTLKVNLVASASLTRACIPHFQRQGGGRIIHIASRAAFRGDQPAYAAYAASKGGMVAYSRSIARAYGKDNICSFVVAPGFTRTDMAQQFMDEFGEEIAVNDLALNRLTEPEDIAPTVLFLASGHMDHATGCSIDINAGSYVR